MVATQSMATSAHDIAKMLDQIAQSCTPAHSQSFASIYKRLNLCQRLSMLCLSRRESREHCVQRCDTLGN